MKKRPLALSRLSSLLSSLAMIPAVSQAATLVDLSATTLPTGPVTSWPNSGTAGGTFTATGTPQVVFVNGYRAVNLANGGQYFTGPPAPAAITGLNKPVTVEAWVYNPNIPGEETVLAWGRRGGPDGTNASYNYGNDSRWGAVGHWGAPDIGWIDQDVTVGAPSANAWHYLVWTYDGVTERLYSDALAMHFEAKSLNIWDVSNASTPLPIRLGCQNNDNGTVAQFNDGINLLRIRIKDTVMTPAEISSNYTAEKAALDTTVVATINSYTASPSQFFSGEAVTLAWNVSNAVSASIDNGVGAVSPTSGSIVLHPTAKITYTLSVTNANGTLTSPVTLRPYFRPLNTHRWSFDGGGTDSDLVDTVGNATGVIRGNNGTVSSGNGMWERTATEVKLGGGASGTSAYIDLPNGIISAYPEVTIEGWLTLNSNQNWGRMFDFGNNSAGEILAPGGTFNGSSYLTVTSQVGGDQNLKRLELLPGGGTLDISDPVVQGQQFYFALVYDSTGSSAGQPQMKYYKNGVLKGSLNTAVPLSAISDVNNWLGRSNYAGDNNTDGSYNEFRVWAGELRDEDIMLSFTNGPDAATLLPTSPPLISAFAPSEFAFAAGDAVTLTWSISGAITSSSIDQGIGPVAATGSTVVHPTTTTTYTLSSTNGFGTSTKQITLKPLHMTHRWSFNEASGIVVKDSVGGATGDGTILGTEGVVASGNGLWARDGRTVAFGGGDSQTSAYVDLPNHILSPLTDATIEGWITITGSQNWSRLFDFGNNTAGEIFAPGGVFGGANNFILSAEIGTDLGVKRLEFNGGGPVMDIPDPVVLGERFHYAVVYDSKGNNGVSPRLSYYKNGVFVQSSNTARPLSALDDVNNWLIRSNWNGDANTDGILDEFRLWDTAMSATQVTASATAGPDAVPFAPPATGPVTFSSPPSLNFSGGNAVSIHVAWTSTAGRSYIVEYSTNLTTWLAAREAASGDALIAPATTASSSANAAIPPGSGRIYIRVRDISNP